MEANDTVPPSYKVVLCGRAGVGKTSLLKRFLHGARAESTPQPTIGVDFFLYKGVLPDGREIRLNFWDTAGAERFQAVQNFVWRDARALVFVYDITNKDSYDSMESVLGPAIDGVGSIHPWVVIVGNKVDIQEQRAVSTSEAAAVCRKFNYTLMETSAKDGTNVAFMLNNLCETIDDRFGLRRAPPPSAMPRPVIGQGRKIDAPEHQKRSTTRPERLKLEPVETERKGGGCEC